MLAEERQSLILKKIKKDGIVLTSELSLEFDVTFPTIRRDLDELEKKGVIKKTHGGAVIVSGEELPFSERNVRNQKEKAIIAEKAAGYVTDNDIIFLDAGTTVFQMVDFIRERDNLVVLTNSLKIAVALSNSSNIICILTAGSVKAVSYATIGTEAVRNIKTYKVNKVFLGADGVGEYSFTVQDVIEAQTKRAMMDIASERYLLVDSSKLGKPTFVEVDELSKLTGVITE